jgi:hypothetical protein
MLQTISNLLQPPDLHFCRHQNIPSVALYTVECDSLTYFALGYSYVTLCYIQLGCKVVSDQIKSSYCRRLRQLTTISFPVRSLSVWFYKQHFKTSCTLNYHPYLRILKTSLQALYTRYRFKCYNVITFLSSL